MPSPIRNQTRGWMEEDKGQYDQIAPTAYIHGAAMMISKKVLEEVGPMYEDYFLYYEELDWSERIRKAGYELLYRGHAKVYHKESVSTGVNSPLKLYYLNRNRLLFARRNFPPLNRLACYSYYFFAVVRLPKKF
ncbi:MAG: hypothetical protein U5L96_03410 [Owenweeksia sp.]|nr:hypothetical protein [Owenweeksia sp.]